MHIAKITSIESSVVQNFDVYNLELKTLEDKDDLYYYDVESGLIHHNCLRKDYGMINECFPHTDLLLQAYKINEFMPKFLVDTIKNDLKDSSVIILGYTFKKDTDDTRDSLVPKLINYIKKYTDNIYIVEPNLPVGKLTDTFNNYTFENYSLEDALKLINNAPVKSCISFVGTNHSVFNENNTIESIKLRSLHYIDIWNSIL